LSAELGITVKEGKYLEFIDRKRLKSWALRQLRLLKGFRKWQRRDLSTMRLIVERSFLLGVEKLLVDFVGLDAPTACNEASKLELAVTDRVVNCICKTFNHTNNLFMRRAYF